MPAKPYLKIYHLIVTFIECLTIYLIIYKIVMKEIKKLVKLTLHYVLFI